MFEAALSGRCGHQKRLNRRRLYAILRGARQQQAAWKTMSGQPKQNPSAGRIP
jgi:hypothetical protein